MPKKFNSKATPRSRIAFPRDDSNKGEASQMLPAEPGTISGTHLSAPNWMAWQLMDSSFPTGGFAHSSGLEAAWQHGEVQGRDRLVAFVEASLDQLGHGSLPFVMATFDQPERLAEFDELCDAFLINHVANRASRAQGRAFLTAVTRIFNSENGQRKAAGPPYAHFAAVFGACLRPLGFSRETTAQMFLFNQVRSLLAAAVRLNIVGPMEAQVLLRRLSPTVEQILRKCGRLTLEEIAQTAPLLDLWQGAQDRLYSRLFQS